MSFVERTLSFTFTLGSGSFGADTGQTLTVSGLRSSVTVNRLGGISAPSCSGTIYGMTQTQMNRLSTMGKKFLAADKALYNMVSVTAGDTNGASSQVFSGPINDAFADYNDAPENPFQFSANIGTPEKTVAVPPSSYNGSVDVAVAMADLAAKMGRAFENNGVSVQIANPYLPGTLWYQANSIARMARINWYLDDKTLAIWPMNGSRGTLDLNISPDNGLIGYPSYTSTGIMFNMLYNPAVEYGKLITVKSSVQGACGQWNVIQVTHNLSCEMPEGPWFTTVMGNPPYANTSGVSN